ILLIDDVYTTGSTMQAAAMALKKAGAKKVRGFTLARGLCSV
ncbi:MAG: ComF family protein, partial [Candidatus Magasanikbacteria bacterium]|nr:ComF family protein [Candidatus Magasanikbacteria bacterium]